VDAKVSEKLSISIFRAQDEGSSLHGAETQTNNVFISQLCLFDGKEYRDTAFDPLTVLCFVSNGKQLKAEERVHDSSTRCA
jgi:hypothetical protein